VHKTCCTRVAERGFSSAVLRVKVCERVGLMPSWLVRVAEAAACCACSALLCCLTEPLFVVFVYIRTLYIAPSVAALQQPWV
jgi:hypothetical protein